MTDYQRLTITQAHLAMVLRDLGYPDPEEQAAALADVCRTPADLEAMLRDIGRPAPEQLVADFTEVYSAEEMARRAEAWARYVEGSRIRRRSGRADGRPAWWRHDC